MGQTGKEDLVATVTKRKLAVVTGASSGIGRELAEECIESGYDVVLCSSTDDIKVAAAELGGDGARALPVQADLATYDGVEELARSTEALGRPIDALILNAGVGVGGHFLETDLEAELRMIQLNAASLVHLSKRLLPAMVRRGQGAVLITASVTSTAPAPYLAVYGATKAFAMSFAEALRVELEDTGVTVTALQPGATDTPFFERAGMQTTRIAEASKDNPEDVAREGFEAMLAGKDSVIASSVRSKLQGLVNEILPETLKARLQARQTKPGSGSQGRSQ